MKIKMNRQEMRKYYSKYWFSYRLRKKIGLIVSYLVATAKIKEISYRDVLIYQNNEALIPYYTYSNSKILKEGEIGYLFSIDRRIVIKE